MKVGLIFIIVFGILFTSSKSYAQIPISGVVTGTWSQGNTYEVVGDLYIQNGTTLTIEPDVVVKFMDYYRLYVYGILVANGTVGDSIYFTCNVVQNPNRWGGIRFTNANSSCSMSYCTIENSLAQGTEPNGGGIYCSNSSPTFSNCVFKNNNAADYGGGVAIYNNSAPEFTNCTFSNNISATQAGGISTYESSPIFVDCIITGNSSNSGGGVGCNVNNLGTSFPEFSNCLVTNNYAETNGGGIGCYGVSLTLSSCDVQNNFVSGGYSNNGAGVYVNNCTLIMDECNITGNYNADYGGGLYIYECGISITNTLILNNAALTNGGGICLDQSTDNQYMEECIVSNNDAGNLGGGIYVGYSTIGITDCDFNNNTAFSGGGIYLNNYWASVKNSNFIANEAYGNTGDEVGGAICVNGAGADLTNCLFDENVASVGGGIYAYYWNSDTIIDSCSFINNSATIWGGGALFNSYGDINISECLFEGNICLASGGAIRNYQASPTISKCVFNNNNAGISGGAIYNGDGSSPNIKRCTMYRNSAANGGGISNISSSPTINSVIIDSCSNGFGIYFGSGSSSSVIKYCDFKDNFPFDFGGSDIPANLGTITTTNFNGNPCDANYNIFLDPIFVNAGNKDFHLQFNSPCIDAGDPLYGNDPDGTRIDIGKFSYPQPVSVNPDNHYMESFCLLQNFPNPFNPTTTIKFSIPKEAKVTLDVYDILGEKVKALKNEVMKPGHYEVNFSANSRSASGANASALASGVYFYRIKATPVLPGGRQVGGQAEDFVQTKKMVLIR